MTDHSGTQHTAHLLSGIAAGDAVSGERLFQHLYADLRHVAASRLSNERPDHTLQPTALVHEAFLRLGSGAGIDWKGEAHFLATAARCMHRILIDHARKRGAVKRGDGARLLSLDELKIATSDEGIDLIEFEEVMLDLARMDERAARVVEMRFFAGMTMKQIAEVLGVSTTTVDNDWSMARAWLSAALAESSSS